MSDTEHNEQPAEDLPQEDIDNNNEEHSEEEGQAIQLDLNNLPPELANLLQQIQLNPVGQQYFGGDDASEEMEDPLKARDYSKLSTAVFVEPTFATRYKVRTHHQHHQLLNLCELTGDESGLYVYSYDKGLDEAAYRAALEAGTEYQDQEPPGEANDNYWASPPLRKFDFQTQKLFKVPAITLPGIYCIASKYGYVAVNNSGVVQVMHEQTGKVVEGDFKTSENYHQTNNVYFGTMKQSNGEDQVVLLVSKNGGEITMYDLVEDGDRHISRLRQHIDVKWNINHSAFGFFEFGKYLIGAPDYAEGPIIYKMDDAEHFTLVDTFLTFPHKHTSAMMCSWQSQGPLFAMATERGECVVWHFPSRERVKVLLNCALKVKAIEDEEARRQNGELAPESKENNEDTESQGSSEYWALPLHQCVRICKFNPVPLFNYILVFAESNYFIHIVDTRTWEEQIIQTPQAINGLCFSSDGRKLYVAYDDEIVVYELILRTSLLETCLHYIRANFAKKEEFGWNLEALPYDLQFKMNY